MKIVFVTYHNWETKRIGGFHKIAEAFSKAGHEVLFFSFARPYYIALKNEERLNYGILKKLSKGVIYTVDGGNKIFNLTWPTFRLPQPIYKYIPQCINKFLNLKSLTSFRKFNDKFFRGTDVFIFESNGLEIFNLIKKYNKDALYIYRPSDPIMVDGCSNTDLEEERNVLASVDYSFIVNEAGLNLYRKKIKYFDKIVKYEILPNGVDTDLFKLSHDCPKILNRKNTFLYVGARIIEWDLILHAARERFNYNFIIVCPENPPQYFVDKITQNIVYINGVSPTEVPKWITNCDVVIVPNPKGWYKIKPWGITAKYYQAMAAHKPIVAFEDTDELLKLGVFVSHTYTQFVNDLDKAIQLNIKVDYNYTPNDWSLITNRFISKIEALHNAIKSSSLR